MVENILPPSEFKFSRHTTETVNEKLAKHGSVLAEPFKGSTHRKHLVTFASGRTKSVPLRKAMSGEAKGIRDRPLPPPLRVRVSRLSGAKGAWSEGEINNQLAYLGVSLAEPYKGKITVRHKLNLLNGRVGEVNLSKALSGLCLGKRVRNNTTETINDALKKHGAVLAEPFGGKTIDKHRITFGCGHTVRVAPHGVMRGKGCPICFRGGFNPDMPGFLYIICVEFQGKTLYKIGITNKTIKQRYSQEHVIYDVLSLFSGDGKSIQEVEMSVLRAFKSFKYDGESPFKNTGTKEVFTRDIGRDSKFLRMVEKNGLIRVAY